MEFTVEIDIVKEPERFEKYIDAFSYGKPLDTGSRVSGAVYHSDDGVVYCTFKIRS